MGLRFRRSINVAPGIRLNFGPKGFASVSIGGRGARMTIGNRGTTHTVSMPGTGLSYSEHAPRSQQVRPIHRASYPLGLSGWIVVFSTVAIIYLLLFNWVP